MNDMEQLTDADIQQLLDTVSTETDDGYQIWLALNQLKYLRAFIRQPVKHAHPKEVNDLIRTIVRSGR